MRRVLSFIDWRFVLSVAFLVLVTQVAFNAWSVADVNQHLRTTQRVERATAARERAELMQRINQIETHSQQNAESLSRLQAWLNDQGIVVPDSVLRPAASRDNDDSDDDDDSDDPDDASAHRSGQAGKQTSPKRPNRQSSSDSEDRDTIQKDDPTIGADRSSGDRIEQKSPTTGTNDPVGDTRDTTTGDTVSSVSE